MDLKSHSVYSNYFGFHTNIQFDQPANSQSKRTLAHWDIATSFETRKTCPLAEQSMPPSQHDDRIPYRSDVIHSVRSYAHLPVTRARLVVVKRINVQFIAFSPHSQRSTAPIRVLCMRVVYITLRGNRLGCVCVCVCVHK